MEIANVRVRLSKDGSDVPRSDVTPAEAMFLHILHQANNGGLTFGDEFKHIKVIGQAMVDTGKQEKKVTKEAIPARMETIVISPAISQQGEVGKPGFVAAKDAVTKEVEVEPAKDEEFIMVPILRPRTDAEELRRLANLYSQALNKKSEPIINEVWPDKFNPKLPQTFKDIPWAVASASGIEPAAVNYATGQAMAEPIAAPKGK